MRINIPSCCAGRSALRPRNACAGGWPPRSALPVLQAACWRVAGNTKWLGVYPEPARIPLAEAGLASAGTGARLHGRGVVGPETHGGDLQVLRRLTARRPRAMACSGRARRPPFACQRLVSGVSGQRSSRRPTRTSALSQRIKLEYERDCFRRAEMRIRERLLKLQRAVAVTARAVKRAEHRAVSLCSPWATRGPALGLPGGGRAMRPRLRLAIADRAPCCDRQPKSLDASGGGDRRHVRRFHPHLECHRA